MDYISLFSGGGGFEIAIHDLFFDAECMFFSEIDRHAIKVYKEHFPNHLNIGDITKATNDDLEFYYGPKLLVGGSPCQDLSIAKKDRQGLKGEKSKLFFEYCRVLEVTRPKFFILENVASMSEENKNLMIDFLTEASGFQKVYCEMIDSNLVSAQNRKRLYFTNFPVTQPADRKILLKDIVAWSRSTRYKPNGESYVEERETKKGKANTLTTGNGCGNFSSKNFINGEILTPEECEALQTFPIGWTKNVSKTQRYKIIGNAVTAEVIYHILSCLPKF